MGWEFYYYPDSDTFALRQGLNQSDDEVVARVRNGRAGDGASGDFCGPA